MQLGEVERCRKIYEKQISVYAGMSNSWIAYAEFESALEEHARARSIYESAVKFSEDALTPLDLPENLWKAWIDFEVAIG